MVPNDGPVILKAFATEMILLICYTMPFKMLVRLLEKLKVFLVP